MTDHNKPTHGDLRVWHIPQVPMRPYHVPVPTVIEAKLVLNTLADYDLFQLANRIKPDFASAQGLEVFDTTDTEDGPDGSWLEWETEGGVGIGDLELWQLRTADARAMSRWYGLDKAYIERSVQ
jgi:hypothetical protein